MFYEYYILGFCLFTQMIMCILKLCLIISNYTFCGVSNRNFQKVINYEWQLNKPE